MVIAALLAATVTIRRLPAHSALDGWSDDGQCWAMKITHSATLPRVRLQSPAAAATLNAIVERKVRDDIGYDDTDDDAPEGCTKKNTETTEREAVASCKALRADERFVGIACNIYVDMGAHPVDGPLGFNFEIIGDRVRELKMGDLFVRDYKEPLRVEFLRALAENPREGDPLERIVSITLSRRGIDVAYDETARDYQTIEIPYARLHRVLRPAIWRHR